MSGHARLSASQTKRWWYCPGSIPAIALFPEAVKPSGEAADLGTAAHRIVEECLLQGKMPIDFKNRVVTVIIDGGETSILRKGAKLKDHTDTHRYFLVDDDMMEATTTMVEYVLDRLEAYGEPRDSKLAVENGVLLVETQVNPLPDRDDTGGTGDVILKAFDELEVIDYKNGSGVLVPVEGNHQLRTYGGGALVHMGDEGDDFENIRYTIVQPRHFSGGIMSESMSNAEMKAWLKELGVRAAKVDEATDAADELLQSGASPEDIIQDLASQGYLSVGDDGSHCGFCDLKSRCPAISNKAQELAQIDFEDEPETIEAPTGGADVLSKILPWVPMLDSWTKAVAKEAETLALGGATIDGYKVVRKTGNRTLKTEVSERDVVSYLVEHHEVDEDACFTDPELLSGPQLEKLITSENKGGHKSVKAAKAAFDEACLYKPEGGLALVPNSDRRQAVAVDADADFADEEI